MKAFLVQLLTVLLVALNPVVADIPDRRDYKSRIEINAKSGDFCGKTPPTIDRDFSTSCGNINTTNSTICDQAWNGFSGAFKGKAPATVTANDYQPYFDVIPITADQNQSLFWSGTFAIVAKLSEPNSGGPVVVSSANTPSGVIINDLGFGVNWCGNTTSPSGIDYTNNCLCNVTTQFWIHFSAEFARAAKGSNYFLGDGERENGTFGNTSFFSTVEIPNMIQGVVKEVVAIIVHRKEYGESCADTGNSSIITLRNRVTARGFLFDCYDIYGQANVSSQTNTIANCVATVISGIQTGRRPPNHQVNCVLSPFSGATTVISSSFGVMIMFAAVVTILAMII